MGQPEWAEPVITVGMFVLVACLLVKKTFVGDVDTTLATKSDLHLLEIVEVVGFSGTFWSLAELRKDTAQLFENHRKDMAQLHNELLKDMAQLRNDLEIESRRNFASLRDDIENLRI